MIGGSLISPNHDKIEDCIEIKMISKTNHRHEFDIVSHDYHVRLTSLTVNDMWLSRDKCSGQGHRLVWTQTIEQLTCSTHYRRITETDDLCIS